MKTYVHLWSYLAEAFLISEKVVEKIKEYISCSIIFFSKNHAIYETMRKNMVPPERPQVTI